MAGNSSSSGNSNFENATHQALYDMVAGGDHMVISFTGACLVQAGKEIDQIATELKAHVERVQWEGEGADAFREWSHDTVKQSHNLAHFASTTGNAISDAGTALWEAKTMPKPKQDNSVKLDSAASPTARSATGAPLMTDPDREAAVAAMNRLASYYRTAQEKIESQEPPNFKPASGFVPDPPREVKGIGERYTFVDQPGGTSTGNGAGGAGAASSTVSSGGEQRAGVSRPTAGGVQQDPQVGTSVNSTAPVDVPDATPSKGGTTTVTPEHSGKPSQPVVPGMPTIPGATKAPSGRGGTTRTPLPDTVRPGVAQERPRNAMQGGVAGATTQRGGTATGRPRLPGGTVMGEERGVLPPRPAATGGDRPVAGSGANGGQAGRSGQRLAPPRGEAVGAPRGPVVGEERGAMARGATGGGYPGGASSGVNRRVPGRRWAYEPGGTAVTAPGGTLVGGAAQHIGKHEPVMGAGGAGGAAEAAGSRTPSATGSSSASGLGGVNGRAQAPRGQSGEFTPGGSGLTRGNPSDSVHPVPGAPLSSRGRRSSAWRPDYLQEDSETWTAQDRSVVPPVIE